MINRTTIKTKGENPVYINIETNDSALTSFAMNGLEIAFMLLKKEIDIQSENFPENEEDEKKLQDNPHQRKFNLEEHQQS